MEKVLPFTPYYYLLVGEIDLTWPRVGPNLFGQEYPWGGIVNGRMHSTLQGSLVVSRGRSVKSTLPAPCRAEFIRPGISVGRNREWSNKFDPTGISRCIPWMVGEIDLTWPRVDTISLS